jgi:DNA-binding transcriptional MerR regulator
MMKQKYFILSGDEFDLKFLGWFLQNDEAKKFKTFINEKNRRVRNDDLTYRTINHWHESGLINDDRKDAKGWRKFSLVDSIWLQVLIELRQFGVPIKTLLNTKAHLERIEDSKHGICRMPILEYYMLTAMQSEVPIYLLIFKDGEAHVATKNELEISKQAGTIGSTYITIDLQRILHNLKKDPKEQNTNYLSEITITDSEKSILNSIRDEKVSQLTIKLNSGSIVSIDTTQIVDKGIKISDLLRVGEYQEVVIKQYKGKIHQVVQTKKYHPNNGTK